MRKFLMTVLRSDVFEHLTKAKYLPRWAVLIIDVLIALLALMLAVFIASKFYEIEAYYRVPIELRVFLFLMLQAFFFWFFRTYSGVIRYSSFVDATKLFFAVFINTVLVAILSLLSSLVYGELIFDVVTLFLYFIFSFTFLFLFRLSVKTIYDYLVTGNPNATPVVIYGTQSSGLSIAKMILSERDMKFKLVAFVDDDKSLSSKDLMGVKVCELNQRTIDNLLARKVKTVILSPMKMKTLDLKNDLEVFINNGFSIKVFPPIEDFGDEGPSMAQLKTIRIEDLLNRPKIELATETISEKLKDRVILVTGGVGSIGSEIVKQCLKFSPKLIVVLDQAESSLYEMELRLTEKYPNQKFAFFIGDVRNKKRMEQLMKVFRPDVVFHAAAYKHVPLMEDNPEEAVQVNIKGTMILADLAVEFDVARFVMISTDKAVNPTNVMGASKRIAEIYVQSLNNKVKKEGGNTKFITTRFGNVLGSNGSVVPRFTQQIESGGPVTVTHPEIVRYFMTIPEACMLVLEAGTSGVGGEIFIFDMGDPVKIADLAKKMIRLAGYKPNEDIMIKYTGLRPGEKLYEELLNQKEITKETNNPKIMIANVREYDFDLVSSLLQRLIEESYFGKSFLTVSMMKEIVPEFISNNSRYEKLDLSEN